MWNVKSSNKLVERARTESAHRRHLRALGKIKGLVDNSSPQQYPFLYSRLKQRQIQMERNKDIENSNSILVSRMVQSACHTMPSATFLKESLNAPLRTRLERAIDNDNQKLVRRLQSAKSQYSRQAKYNFEFDRYRTSMAYSRMATVYDLDPPFRPSTRALSSKR